jgi:hypothetical protein
MKARILLVAATALLMALVAGAVTGAGAATGAGAVPIHSNIRPHQLFVGAINGSTGDPAPAVIKVTCPVPFGPGQTGHPLGDQFVMVRPATSTAASTGNTGDGGTSVAVFSGPPPPAAAAVGELTFYRYGVGKPIPTTLSVPCSGTGTVSFVPFPRDPPTSRSANVAVTYVNVSSAASR